MSIRTDDVLAAPTRDDDEPLLTLFRVVLTVSAVSWGGLALMAQLEQHYVARERRLTETAFSDLVALAWMVPGPVGCNVAVQLGHVLRGRAGAWVAGVASVLPFFALMTAFAIFYRTPLVHAAASRTLLDHFSVVLAMLIGVTWYRQTRALVRGPLEWGVALAACVALALAASGAAYVVILIVAFAVGWLASPVPAQRLDMRVTRRDVRLLAALAALIA
ncbi:MAG TPA: chromate transporter, partial [Paraburkholderia sp.]